MINAKYNTARLTNDNETTLAGQHGNFDSAASFLNVSTTTLRKVVKELRAATRFCREGEEEVYFYRYTFSNGNELEWVNPAIDRTALQSHQIRVTHNTNRRHIMLATTNGSCASYTTPQHLDNPQLALAF